MKIVTNFFSELLNEEGFDQPIDDIYDQAALSDLLKYRVFDPQTGLYFNDKTTGFIIELVPQLDTDEIVPNLHSSLITEMPANAGIQIINWTSPNIEGILTPWALNRVQGGELMEEMSSRRFEHIHKMRYGSDLPKKLTPLRRRIFITGWIEGETKPSRIREVQTFKKSILTAIGTVEPKDHDLGPLGLLGLLQEMLHAKQWGKYGNASYTSELPINLQVPGTTIKSKPDHLVLGDDPELVANVSSVAKFPSEWNSAMGILLFGHPDVIDDRPHGPVLTVLSACTMPSTKMQNDIIKSLAIMDRKAKSGLAKFDSDFSGKQAELANLSNELQSGERMFSTSMTVVAYAKGGKEEAKAAGAEMAKIYRRAGFTLRDEKRLQLPMFLGSLPFGMDEKVMNTYMRLMRMRKLKGKVVAAISPIQGEFTGNSRGAGVLLAGRQGELFSWDNFTSEGNYNVSVVGKSGAGKSVFMQELITSIFANGGKALVIDDGYSFKTTCEILGGKHIAFDGESELKLNPFSMLDVDHMGKDEYRVEATVMISQVIASMVSLGAQREGRVEGIEEEAIQRSVNLVWDQKGSKGEISDVLQILTRESAEESRLVDVCKKLKAFSNEGPYGKYFTGQSNVSIDNSFTVVELSDIKTQPALEQVVLQIIMFLGTELMYKTNRSTRVAILIDEAWDMLKGHGTAKFIEGVARRARKYTGALITGTQSIDDYFANPAAEVCYQNSDWLVMLAQKPETIDRLAEDKKLSVDRGFAARLKTITSVPNAFSEMAVKGQQGWFMGRLALDPFSLAIFSSKGSTVEKLNQRRSRGMSTVEALKDMVEQGDVS
jgi:conjugal transfer ATP-binding protein TraC